MKKVLGLLAFTVSLSAMEAGAGRDLNITTIQTASAQMNELVQKSKAAISKELLKEVIAFLKASGAKSPKKQTAFLKKLSGKDLKKLKNQAVGLRKVLTELIAKKDPAAAADMKAVFAKKSPVGAPAAKAAPAAPRIDFAGKGPKELQGMLDQQYSEMSKDANALRGLLKEMYQHLKKLDGVKDKRSDVKDMKTSTKRKKAFEDKHKLKEAKELIQNMEKALRLKQDEKRPGESRQAFRTRQNQFEKVDFLQKVITQAVQYNQKADQFTQSFEVVLDQNDAVSAKLSKKAQVDTILADQKAIMAHLGSLMGQEAAETLSHLSSHSNGKALMTSSENELHDMQSRLDRLKEKVALLQMQREVRADRHFDY